MVRRMVTGKCAADADIPADGGTLGRHNDGQQFPAANFPVNGFGAISKGALLSLVTVPETGQRVQILAIFYIFLLHAYRHCWAFCNLWYAHHHLDYEPREYVIALEI